MAIRIKCPNPSCGRLFTAREEHIGRLVECPSCATSFPIKPLAPPNTPPPQQFSSAAQAAPPSEPQPTTVQTTQGAGSGSYHSQDNDINGFDFLMFPIALRKLLSNPKLMRQTAAAFFVCTGVAVGLLTSIIWFRVWGLVKELEGDPFVMGTIIQILSLLAIYTIVHIMISRGLQMAQGAVDDYAVGEVAASCFRLMGESLATVLIWYASISTVSFFFSEKPPFMEDFPIRELWALQVVVALVAAGLALALNGFYAKASLILVKLGRTQG